MDPKVSASGAGLRHDALNDQRHREPIPFSTYIADPPHSGCHPELRHARRHHPTSKLPNYPRRTSQDRVRRPGSRPPCSGGDPLHRLPGWRRGVLPHSLSVLLPRSLHRHAPDTLHPSGIERWIPGQTVHHIIPADSHPAVPLPHPGLHRRGLADSPGERHSPELELLPGRLHLGGAESRSLTQPAVIPDSSSGDHSYDHVPARIPH